MRKYLLGSFIFLCIISTTYLSCSKGGGGGNTPAPPNPCAGISVAVTATVSDASSGQSNGSITAAATGGTGFTFKIGTGAYQASGTFTNLAAGSHTITAKNSNGCEGSASFTVGTTNVCNGVNITVSAATSNATLCVTPNNGSITITASGSTGLSYSINGTTFQASNVFSGVAAGAYTVTVKDANGCTKTASATIDAVAAGTLFAAVKQLLQNNCVSCHSASNANGGMNWELDCNIVTNSGRIKARAVDQAGTPTQMPFGGAALSAADQKKITDWITAGGNYTD